MIDDAGRHSRRRFLQRPGPIWMRPDAHLWIRPDAARFMPLGWRDQEPFAALLLDGGRVRERTATAMAPPPTRMFTEAERGLLLRMLADYRMIAAEIRTMRDALEGKVGFNPSQPRVPAGRSDGGQWTDSGNDQSLPMLRPVRLADAGGTIGSPVMSDASPDPIVPGARYAMAQIEIHPSALTGIETIDDTTKKLTATLAAVMDNVEYIPGMSAQQYGIAVHVAFATAVRIANFRGIRFFDVETTFGADGARYGSKDSIRTDVVLRNDAGDIIAIYDAKTLGATLRPSRVRELRQKTGTGPEVPIIEMHVTRGIHGKMAVGVRTSHNLYLRKK